MDLLNKISGDSSSSTDKADKADKAANSGGGFMDKMNNMAGGGQRGEENEDGLDKRKFLGQGDQSNESAAEQAKDEAISDFIRDKYKDTTGSDFPIPDKEKKYGL